MGKHLIIDKPSVEYRKVQELTKDLPEDRRYVYVATKTGPDGEITLVHNFADGTRCFGYQEVVDMLSPPELVLDG